MLLTGVNFYGTTETPKKYFNFITLFSNVRRLFSTARASHSNYKVFDYASH